MAWMPLAAAGVNLAGSLFGGRRRNRGMQDMPNPVQAAQPYFQQIPQVQSQYLSPYLSQNVTPPENYYQMALNEAQNVPNIYGNVRNLYERPIPEYEAMRRNPQEFVNNIMRGYTPSEGYRFKENRMLNAARNSAAAGGYAGSSFANEEAADTVRGLLGQDMQDYFRNIIGTQQLGLGGEERRLTGEERMLENILSGRERQQERMAEARRNAFAGMAGQSERREQNAFNAAQALATGQGANLATMGTLGYQGALDERNRRMAELNRRDEERRSRRDLLGTAMGLGANMFANRGGGGGGFGGLF